MRYREALVRREQGVALVIAMVLLLIVTVLAISGMSTASAELIMAGNEQFHRRAIDAASAGVEAGIARVAAAAGGRGEPFTDAGNTRAGEYTVTSRYAGEEAGLAGFSADKFSALHYELESTGTSARNTRDRQLQGVMLITSRGSSDTFTQLADGLATP